MDVAARNDLIQQLRQEVLSLQGFKRSLGEQKIQTGLCGLEAAFPNQVFPTGAVHEFISTRIEDATATNGFIAGLLSSLIKRNGVCVWVSSRRTIFPPALTLFGIRTERIIFIDCKKQKELLWTVEEALKCEVIGAVIGELSELDFKESRRLQLAVEQSRVTGLIHRYQPKTENTVACVTRWKVKPLPSNLEDGMPGVGFPRWRVQLVKVRNGRPGFWDIEWKGGKFNYVAGETYPMQLPIRKAV